MKHLVLFFTLFSLLFTPSFDAEARKKFGSKKSKGKTHQTTTTQQKKTDTQSISPKKKSSKKGIMAGIFGGLLAGGLIAAMMGDDFEGFQILEMLMFAGVAFLLFKLVKGFMNRQSAPNMTTASGHQFKQSANYQQPINTSNSAGFSQQTVPFNLPPNFDVNGFLQGAREHYKTVRTAWNNSEFDTLAQYLAPNLVEEFKQERLEHDSVQTEVMFVDAELVRVEIRDDIWELSVRFNGKYRDLSDKQEEAILEVWHLERNSTGGDWLIVGVEDLAAD